MLRLELNGILTREIVLFAYYYEKSNKRIPAERKNSIRFVPLINTTLMFVLSSPKFIKLLCTYYDFGIGRNLYFKILALY